MAYVVFWDEDGDLACGEVHCEGAEHLLAMVNRDATPVDLDVIVARFETMEEAERFEDRGNRHQDAVLEAADKDAALVAAEQTLKTLREEMAAAYRRSVDPAEAAATRARRAAERAAIEALPDDESSGEDDND